MHFRAGTKFTQRSKLNLLERLHESCTRPTRNIFRIKLTSKGSHVIMTVGVISLVDTREEQVCRKSLASLKKAGGFYRDGRILNPTPTSIAATATERERERGKISISGERIIYF